MHSSRKYTKRAQKLWGGGDFVLCSVPLTKHCKRRCNERNIRQSRVLGERARAIVKGGVVVTVWQKPPANYGTRCTKGIEHMRKTHKAVRVPREVVPYIRKKAKKQDGMTKQKKYDRKKAKSSSKQARKPRKGLKK